MKAISLRQRLEFGLEQVLSDLQPLAASAEAKTNLDELRQTFRGMRTLDTTGSVAAEATWLRFENRLRELVLHEDARRFLQWDIIRQTMFVTAAPYTNEELTYLRANHDWKRRWREAIRESAVGAPTRCLRYPATSRNLIHQAHHVARFEEWAGYDVGNLGLVFEFGGGYGSMCRLLHRLGFRGQYVIMDLPALSALQLYYLKTAGLPAARFGEGAQRGNGITCTSDLAVLRNLLAGSDRPSEALFIATWSLSEAEPELRANILKLVSEFQWFLLAYQDVFAEIDNRSAFDHWKRLMPQVVWEDQAIRHLPGNHYLFGRASTDPDVPA